MFCVKLFLLKWVLFAWNKNKFRLKASRLPRFQGEAIGIAIFQTLVITRLLMSSM